MTREEYLAFQRGLEQRQRYDEGSPERRQLNRGSVGAPPHSMS